MKFSVCIDMMFSAMDFYSRFSAVKACGIDTVEFWKWSNKDIGRIDRLLAENGINVSIFNLDSSDKDLSARLVRGILNTGDISGIIKAIRESAPVYHRLNASGMIVLVGEKIENISYNEQVNRVTEALAVSVKTAEAEGINLLVEPLNAFDRKNYFMPYSQPLFEILRDINSPNLKILFDIYHQQMTEGGVIDKIRENIGLIGHFHVADCPGRHEPGTGVLNYPNILREIDNLGYSGYVGLEYRATKNDKETLEFMYV